MKKTNQNFKPDDINYPSEIHYISGDEGEEGYYIAFLPDFGFSACGAAGDTPEEALNNLNEVKKFVIETYLEDGDQLPSPSPNPTEIKELQQMPIRIPKRLHDKLKRLSKQNAQSLNSYVNSIFIEHLALTAFEEKLDAMFEKKWQTFCHKLTMPMLGLFPTSAAEDRHVDGAFLKKSRCTHHTDTHKRSAWDSFAGKRNESMRQ